MDLRIKNLILGVFAMLFCISNLPAQNVALGTWQTHLPYRNAYGVAASKENIYCAAEYAVFSYNINDRSIKKYSTSEGLSDVGIAAVGYDTLSKMLLVAYTNSNLDLLQNGKVTNLPFIKDAVSLSDKQIRAIATTPGKAFLATGFGIVEISVERKEIKDSYIFTTSGNPLAVNSVWADENTIYAATANGLYTGEMDGFTNLVNFAEWKLLSLTEGLPNGKASAVTGRDGAIFVAINNTIFKKNGENWVSYYDTPGWTTISMFKGKNRLLFSQYLYSGNNITDQRIVIIDDNGNINIATANFFIQRPVQIIENEAGEIYYSDVFRGLVSYESTSKQSDIVPNGPSGPTCKEADFLQGKMWVASSSIERNWNPVFNKNGFYASENYFWENFNESNIPELTDKIDIAVLKALPAEKKIFMGAHASAFLEFTPETKAIKVISSLPNTTTPLRPSGAVLDNFGNLWICNAYSSSPIICRKAGGDYVTFNSTLLNNKLLTAITIDDYNQVWVAVNDGGIVVLNYGGSIDDKSDDRYITFTTTPGEGGLPNNSVISLANDLEGQIWIGTTEGVAYVPCPASVFDRFCDAQQVCIPRNDGTNICDLLLQQEVITCINIDPGNRKWFGTSNGLFLQSSDGLKNIHYFNESNSPLLSNIIRNIAIHPDNGDLYISTAKGIVTYRAEATSTGNLDAKAFAYPNPVRPEYKGPIAVKNLPNNSSVKITDISGNLVYEATATGGQIVWDGNDVFGNSVSSGIYYVLAVSKDNKEKKAAKIAVIR